MAELKDVDFMNDTSIIERRIDLEIKREDIEMEHGWRSCLCDKKTDSRLLKYCTTMLIMLIIICFCILQLANAETCEETTTYISLLTLVLGIAIPAPSQQK